MVKSHSQGLKYVSVNLHDNYVEFRSPGGDWLNYDFEVLANTLRRFVVALDAAMDPQKYQREYYSKLYKLLTPDDKSLQGQSVVDLFARSAAGALPKSALIQFLRQRDISRTLKQGLRRGQKYVWRVYVYKQSSAITVLSDSESEAKQLAKLMNPAWQWSSNLVAEPVQVYRPGPMQWYKAENNQGQVQRITATSELEARQKLSLAMPDRFGLNVQMSVEPIQSST